MKKKLSLVLAVLAFCGAANAAVWDFEKGLSAETIAAITADTENWTVNSTKPDEYEVGEAKLISRHNAKTWEEAAPLTAGGVELKEFAGLKFTASGADAIRIGAETTQLCTDFGFAAGTVSRLRVTNTAKLILPAMVAGDEITIKWGSSKPKDPDTGRYPISDQLTAISGVPGTGAAGDYKSQTMYEMKYRVNDDITEPTEIVITSAKSGIDIFYLECDGGGPVIETAKKTLLVTNDADELSSINGIVTEGVEWAETPVLASATISVDDEAVKNVDVVVISSNVPADAAIAASLKGLVAYKPVVNLSAALYKAWGYGEATPSESMNVTLTEAYAANEALSALVSDAVVLNGYVATVTLGDYFKNDAIIATVDDKPAIHIHNASRNAYIGAPLSADAIANAGIADLIVMAAKTNKAVTATATPAFSQKQANQETTLTITCGTAGATIYYTEDGSEPTVASKVYTEPLVYHAETTVKAVAIADGYSLSAVGEYKVTIAAQVATPEIAVAKNGATSTVTLTCATEGATIYFSVRPIKMSNSVILAEKYVNPVEFKEPTPFYAIAIKDGSVPSDTAQVYVAIDALTAANIRLDVVSHATFKPGTDKSAWLMPADQKITDGESFVYNSKNSVESYWGTAAWNDGTKKEYVPNADCGDENDWKIVSEGQAMAFYNKGDAPADGVGDIVESAKLKADDNGRVSGYYAETAQDLIGGIASPYTIRFGNAPSKTEGEGDAAVTTTILNGALQSANGFDAPYDVVVLVGNCKNGTGSIETSTDGTTWTPIADFKMGAYKRYIKRVRASVEGTGKVFVRVKGSNSMNIYDVFIYNNGEKSKEYDAEKDAAAGIEDVETVGAEVVRTEIYNINGVQLPELTTGVNIVRTYYSDGSVKTEKILSK